jgi:hypothetical protein
MTHLWKSEERYTIDMPEVRIDDVYGKNARFPIGPYIKYYNPKVSKVEFDATMPGMHITVSIPKYPESYPYFTEEDVKTLLESYMNYANSTREEMHAWYKNKQDSK